MSKSKRPKKVNILFAEERNRLRDLVETYFADLQANARSLITSSREVLSSREAYRLAVLRYQAGVDSQRNVIDNQRDVTQAEVITTTGLLTTTLLWPSSGAPRALIKS